MTVTTNPPQLPEALRLVASTAILTLPGQTTQLRVTGILADGTELDLTPRSRWTVYRTSNPNIATVDGDGLVTARGEGGVYITAGNEGATAVTRIFVLPGDPLTTVEGFVQLADGTPVGGAAMSIFALPQTATSEANGHFVITMVPTRATSNLVVRARATVGGTNYVGTSVEILPVPGGSTDAGVITLREGGGQFGPIIVSGMDPEDHFPAGGEMTRDMLRFIVMNSALHPAPASVLMLGGDSFNGSRTRGLISGFGYTLTQVTGAAILTADLNAATTPYDAIYMPTGVPDVGGEGLSQADLDRINARSADIIEFVNRGGGLAAFAQRMTGGFAWFPLGGLVTTSSVNGTGIEVTPEGAFILSPSATAVEPFHQAFTGPPGFFGLQVLARESDPPNRPLIIGGLADIPSPGGAGAQLAARAAGSPVQAPVLKLPTGQVQINLAGDPGRPYLVECSSDLVRWAPLGTVLAGDTGIFYTDLSPETPACRFYRAVPGP